MLDAEGWNIDAKDPEKRLPRSLREPLARTHVRAPHTASSAETATPICRGSTSWARTGGGWWRRGP